MTSSKERKLARLKSGEPDILSKSKYNLIIGLCIMYAFVVNAIIVWTCQDLFANLNMWVLLIGYFVCCLVGIFLSAKSKNPIVSFIGYNLVVVPIGAVLSVCLPGYPAKDILVATLTTAGVVLIMTLLATAKPLLFSKMGATLFLSLLIGIIAEVVAILLGYEGNIFNWIFVVIFSLYIGYDWCKAQAYPKTIDNAVDAALDLYLDIINLFLRLLEIFSDAD